MHRRKKALGSFETSQIFISRLWDYGAAILNKSQFVTTARSILQMRAIWLSGMSVNLLTPSGFFTYHQGLISKNSTWRSLCVECFVQISEQTATFALYIIDWLAFITVVEGVYCAVRPDPLYKADYVSSLKVSHLSFQTVYQPTRPQNLIYMTI